MPDDPTLDNGSLADVEVSADLAGTAYVQRFKLAYSADGVATHVPADADGLLVNTGATVSATGGTNEGIGSFLIDTDGDALTYDTLHEFSGTPTLGTAACAQFDALHATPITLAAVVNGNGGTGHIMGAVLTSKHNTFSGQILAAFFRTTPGAQTAQDAVSVTDTANLDYVGRAVFDFAETNFGTARSANAQRADMPVPFKCDTAADDLFVLLQLWDASTPTFAAGDLTLRVAIQPD